MMRAVDYLDRSMAKLQLLKSNKFDIFVVR